MWCVYYSRQHGDLPLIQSLSVGFTNGFPANVPLTRGFRWCSLHHLIVEL